MSDKVTQCQQARILMRTQHSGVLATQSLSMKGFPFGSVTPFLMTEAGDIVIYASDIAQHSRNMKTDPHVSLCVYDGTQNDSQASARVTIMAHAKPDVVSEDLQARYFSLFPQARKYLEAHDFRFYLLTTERVRYIGGFGEIYWFSTSDWQTGLPQFSQSVDGVIEHMHDDHADALAEIFNHITSSHAAEGEVCMQSCFAEGFHVKYADKTHFLPFVKTLSRQYDVRKAMVDLTKLSRTVELERAG